MTKEELKEEFEKTVNDLEHRDTGMITLFYAKEACKQTLDLYKKELVEKIKAEQDKIGKPVEGIPEEDYPKDTWRYVGKLQALDKVLSIINEK